MNASFSLRGINTQGTVTGRISSHSPSEVSRSNTPKTADGMCLGLLALGLSDTERRIVATLSDAPPPSAVDPTGF